MNTAYSFSHFKKPKPVKKQRKPLRRSQKAVRKVSKGMARNLSHYNKLRKVYLEAFPICGVCNAEPSQEIHHRKGRGKFLLNHETWLAVSRKCHRKIHDNVKWSMDNGWLLPRN